MSAMPAQSPASLAVRRCAAPPEPELTTPVRSVAAEFARGDPIIELQIDEVLEHLAELPPDNAAEIEWPGFASAVFCKLSTAATGPLRNL